MIGSLTPGKRADITIVELGRPHSAPRYTYADDAIYSHLVYSCLLYTSDAADERSSVDLGGRRIIKKKKQKQIKGQSGHSTHT